MTMQVKVLLAAMGLVAVTAVSVFHYAHVEADSAVVSEMKREDHERRLERQSAAAKERQDDAAVRAWMFQPIRLNR